LGNHGKMGIRPKQSVSSEGSLLPPFRADERSGQGANHRPDFDRITSYAIELGRERLHPSLSNPDYLVLKQRGRYFSDWVQRVPGEDLSVLDVGGRIQPYRPLVENRLRRYIAIDPLPTGLVDAVAIGEHLPFRDETFDLVICSQVLCYADEPQKVVSEIYRVLRDGGALFVSAPAVFPSHSEHDRWRFIPRRMLSLLADFSEVEVYPEGYSIAGIFRILATYLEFCVPSASLQRAARSIFIPLLNRTAERLDVYSRGDTRFTTNYCAFAKK
jgi:SAM-dependent methyltransferase